jgi:hypothetical protein
MVQILRPGSDKPPLNIHLTFLKHPGFCTTDKSLRKPTWNGARFLDQPRRLEIARISEGTGDNIAREDVRRIWIRISKEIGKGDDLPVISEE